MVCFPVLACFRDLNHGLCTERLWVYLGVFRVHGAVLTTGQSSYWPGALSLKLFTVKFFSSLQLYFYLFLMLFLLETNKLKVTTFFHLNLPKVFKF